jgi:hypothetical protein
MIFKTSSYLKIIDTNRSWFKCGQDAKYITLTPRSQFFFSIGCTQLCI